MADRHESMKTFVFKTIVNDINHWIPKFDPSEVDKTSKFFLEFYVAVRIGKGYYPLEDWIDNPNLNIDYLLYNFSFYNARTFVKYLPKDRRWNEEYDEKLWNLLRNTMPVDGADIINSFMKSLPRETIYKFCPNCVNDYKSTDYL